MTRDDTAGSVARIVGDYGLVTAGPTAAISSPAYVSESNYFNDAWQRAFWGSNYPRLRAVKAKYDPDGLFFVRHGVGSEGWSSDGFIRA